MPSDPADSPPETSRGRRRWWRIGRWFVLAVAFVVLLSGVAVALRPGIVGKVRRRLFPPTVGAVHVFGSGVPAVQPGPGPVQGPINTSFPGLTTFRGNASRDYYGEGPVPSDPQIDWTYPLTGKLCMQSIDNGITFQGAVQLWCGTGWTGQPNVIQQPDGSTEVRIGAYDGAYHFLNGQTGQPVSPDLPTGDLAKGSATSDSDGYPLYYGGSRDNQLRVIAMDRNRPTVLWDLDSMTSVPHPVWNNDWDGAPLQIGDYLLEGGENSWFYVIKLNRSYNAQGLVEVNPKIVMKVPGYDNNLLQTIGDDDVSIESSVAFHDGVAYFGNSGGLVEGWDISDVLRGGTHYKEVFRFWAGGDIDPSIVIDPQGYLYVARHIEDNEPRPQSTARDQQIGNIMKLDPRNPSNPVVWSTSVGSLARGQGILGTPALYNGVVYDTLTDGGFFGVNASTGQLLWTVSLPGNAWMSPVPIDNNLLIGDCTGLLHDYDISNPTSPPPELWNIQLDGCEESTPAVWHGMIYVGTRGGQIYGIGQATAPPTGSSGG
jgi:outer membrane protein assembly factor BamB